MSIVWITSDWHLGHANISKFRPRISSSEENDSLLIENYKSLIHKRDLVWFLGDVAFTNEALDKLSGLPGEKRLILGNHDTDMKVTFKIFFDYFTKIASLVSYKKAWLSHAPIHPDVLRGRINIHGHCHNNKIDDPRYINVCVDHTDMKPVKFQDLI
jgi:calcineurin-like phosphoesterase family protein